MSAQSLEDRMQWLADLEEIKQLKARYYRFNDTQDWASFRAVFIDEAVYDSGTQLLHGADEVVATFSAGLAGGKTAHLAVLPEITISGDTATGIWAFRDYVQLAGDGAPIGFRGHGHEHDEYVRTPSGWKISKVVITRLRVDPLEGGLPKIFERPYASA
jgi:hypothetical protein